MRIEVRIDRVVLDGVSGDPRVIREALQAELSRLVTAAPRATWQQSRRERRVTAPPVRTGTSAALGRRVAQSIHSGLTGGGAR